MKWLLLSVSVGLIAIGVSGARDGATGPTANIEGMNVPYHLVHVLRDGPGTWAVEYYNPEDEIDHMDRVPIKKGKEILAWQMDHKAGRNYEESHGVGSHEKRSLQ